MLNVKVHKAFILYLTLACLEMKQCSHDTPTHLQIRHPPLRHQLKFKQSTTNTMRDTILRWYLQTSLQKNAVFAKMGPGIN